MFFSDRNTAQHRMTRLHDLRLVERFRSQRCGRDGEYHYVLNVLGAYVVAVMANRNPDREITMRWRTDQALSIATSQRLAHTVGANDLFVRLVAAARHRSDAELSTWWGERYCKERLVGIVYPDGVGVWQEGSATVVFCLEYDRGHRAARPTGEEGLRLRPAGGGLGMGLLGPRRRPRSPARGRRPWRPVRPRAGGRHQHRFID